MRGDLRLRACDRMRKLENLEGDILEFVVGK